MGLFLRKNNLLRCWGCLSLLNWVGAVTLSKTTSEKIKALIHSMKFLATEVALYLYRSTIRPCMEWYCLVWAGARRYYLEILDKLKMDM